VRHVSAPRRRRNHNFDLNAKRRKEIVSHALLIDAADTEDFPRWLIAWHWYNPKAKDSIWSLMEAAQRMGGKITEAEASAITEEASITRKCWSADNLARFLGMTYAQRQALGIRTIGSVDIKKQARRALRQRKDRLYQGHKRLTQGARPHSQSLSRTKPWEALNMSRRTWERHRNKAHDANSSAISFLSKNDELATLASGASEEFERGFASKEARGLSSSQTATTTAADIHESLPLELRLLALGLPVPEGLARAA
jgi:hypothetical protein